MIPQLVVPLYAIWAIAALLLHRRRIAKRIGRDPVVIQPLAGRDRPHRFLELALLIGVAAALVDVALNALAYDWVAEQIAVPLLRASEIPRLVGFAMLTAGLVAASVAVRQMGDSWRIGIDADGGALATRGLYARVRHPIYTGVLLATAGLAFTEADVIAASVAVGCWVALPIQARLEEQFLLSRHGDEYAAYMTRTGRFFPAGSVREPGTGPGLRT